MILLHWNYLEVFHCNPNNSCVYRRKRAIWETPELHGICSDEYDEFFPYSSIDLEKYSINSFCKLWRRQLLENN